MGIAQSTKVTSAANALRDMYAVHCARLSIPGEIAHHPVLRGLDGPSTHGGLLARQHLTLESADGGAAITVGWVDVAARKATLRTFACQLETHHARFGSPFPVAAVSYERFLYSTRTFLVDQGISIELEHRPPAVPPPRERAATPWLWAAVATVVATGLVVAWLIAT